MRTNITENNSSVAQRIAARHFLMMNHWLMQQFDRANVARSNSVQLQQIAAMDLNCVSEKVAI